MSVRIAVRALILNDDRLLLVNAYPNDESDLWCAPGGGVKAHSSLPDNLVREVHEETGLSIRVGLPALVNEFHDPNGAFHQVDVFFHAEIAEGVLDPDWRDPEGVVKERRFFARDELDGLRVKPGRLVEVAWDRGFGYDPLEPIVR